jgi:hypothetical protein
LISLDKSWNVLTNLDMSWQILICLDKSWYVLTNLDMSWQILICLDKSWYVLTNLDMSWWILISWDKSWQILISLDNLHNLIKILTKPSLDWKSIQQTKSLSWQSRKTWTFSKTLGTLRNLDIDCSLLLRPPSLIFSLMNT